MARDAGGVEQRIRIAHQHDRLAMPVLLAQERECVSIPGQPLINLTASGHSAASLTGSRHREAAAIDVEAEIPKSQLVRVGR